MEIEDNKNNPEDKRNFAGWTMYMKVYWDWRIMKGYWRMDVELLWIFLKINK